MYATFVKQDMPKKEWDFYRWVNGYMSLGKTGFGIGESISVAFMCATPDGEAPQGMYLLNDEEVRQYDAYCKGSNIYPQPLEIKNI